MIDSKHLRDELYSLIQNDKAVFDFIQDTALDGMCFWSAEEAGINWMSPKYWQIVGYTPQEAEASNLLWYSIIFEEDLEILRNNFVKYYNNQAHDEAFEVRYKHKNGSTVWVKLQFLFIRNADGKPYRILATQTEITRQKEYEQNLEWRIKRYDHIIEGSNLGPWEWNIQTGETLISERFAQILGYTYDEFKHITMLDREKFAHPADFKYSYDLFVRHLKGELPFYEAEVRFRHKNGHWVWVLDKGKVVLRDAEGKAVWMTGSSQDISSRKENELALAKTQDLLSRAMDIARMGSWEIDVKNNTVSVSDNLRKILGMPDGYVLQRGELISRMPLQTHREAVERITREAISQGKSYDVEFELPTFNNRMIWMRSVGIPLFENGVCVKIYGFLQDVTEKNQTLQNLAFQENLFRQTFENAPIGIALVSLQGKWLKVNGNIPKMLGYTDAELLELTFQDITHPEDLEVDLSYVNDLLSGKVESYSIEKRYLHKNGSVVWGLLAVSLIRDSQGEPQYFVSQINDITERKEQYATIQDQNNRLLNFTYIVSHNLRSHSANMTLLINLIKEEKLTREEDPYLPLLEKACNNLSETILHLNSVTQIHTRTEEQLRQLNLYEYIEKAIENIRALAIETNTTIENNADTTITIMAVPAYLDSVILNFLTNAIKYRRADTAPVIKIRTIQHLHHTELQIEDNGLGINLKKFSEKIFGLYKTFHGNKDARGIGLFITKNQIEAMGGSIEVESEINQGTTFKIFFKNETY